MNDQRFRARKSESGQILLTFTMVMAPMLGVVGLVSDIGYMHFVKMSAQTAAEAAARAAIVYTKSAGASAYTCGSNVVCASTETACPSTITTAANAVQDGCLYAFQHGFTPSSNITVTYTSGTSGSPPTVSGGPTASYWVTFRVKQQVPQLFSAVLGNTSGLVVARSSAGIVGAADCIYALNPSASGAVSASGNASISASCGIYDNSDSGSALSENGTASITATEYDVVGGYYGSYTPSPNTGVASIGDPLASLAVPATAPYTCDHNNYQANGTVTLTPGVYCGGIHIKNANATMSAGTYIIVGGGLDTQNTNSNLTGSGVLIYNTYDSGHAFAGISMSGNSSVSLSAGNSGTYAGILYFEDRTAPASSDTFVGGSSGGFSGTLYAKNSALTLVGNSSATRFTIIVADTIGIVGTSNIQSDYSLLPTGSPITKTIVME
jgi:Flp pilus assembly protein TadG